MKNHSKLKNKKLPFIITAFAILIVIMVFIYFKTRLSASERLIKGYTNLFEASDKSISDELDIDKIKKSKKSTLNTEFSIDSCNYMPALKGIEINSRVAKDSTKKKAESVTNLTYRGVQALSADIYVKDNTLYMAVPSLFDDILSIDLSKIDELKDSSYILQQIPDEFYENFDLSVFDDIWKRKSNKLNPITMADYIKETSPNEWKEISEGIKVTETDKRGEIKLSISKKSIKLFLNKSMEILFDDDAFNEYLKEIFNKANIEYSQDAVKSSINRAISMVTLFFKNGIDIYTSLNSRNQITDINCSNKFSLLGIKLNMDINIDYTGRKNPKDKYNGSVIFTYNGNDDIQTLNFEFSKDYIEKNNKVKLNHNYKLEYNDSSVLNITIKSDYKKFNLKSNKALNFIGCSNYSGTIKKDFIQFDSSVNVTSVFSPALEITISGDISDAAKGECFTFNADSIELKSNDQSIISASGKFSVSNKSSGINKPDGHDRNLLKMDEKECRELLEQINENIDRKDFTQWNTD